MWLIVKPTIFFPAGANMASLPQFRTMRITLLPGDITRVAADAIVNAANSGLPGRRRGGRCCTVGPVWSGGGFGMEVVREVIFVCYDETNFRIYR